MLTPPSDRRALLRHATEDLHGELDVIASRLDLRQHADYCKYLLATAGPVIAIELALEQHRVDEVFVDWPLRRRRFALALDLHALGLTATAIEARLAWTRSRMLGAMYVLEGSRLGAQILLRRVEQSSDQSVLAARHFLRGSNPTLWSSFLGMLEDADDSLDAAEMVAAARETFALFGAAFSRYCALPPVATSTRELSPALA